MKEGRVLSPTAKKIELFAGGLSASRLISHITTTLQLVNNDWYWMNAKYSMELNELYVGLKLGQLNAIWLGQAHALFNLSHFKSINGYRFFEHGQQNKNWNGHKMWKLLGWWIRKPFKTKLKGFPFVLQRSVIFLILRLVAFVIFCWVYALKTQLSGEHLWALSAWCKRTRADDISNRQHFQFIGSVNRKSPLGGRWLMGYKSQANDFTDWTAI